MFARVCMVLFLLVAGAGCGFAKPPASSETAQPWALMAEQDLAALRDILNDSHPGVVDPENDIVRKWIKTGYDAALEKARRATDYGGYRYSLRYFVDGFNDTHVILYPMLIERSAQWPQFTAALRKNGVEIIESDIDGLKPGAVLISCDGRSPDELYQQLVAPYFGVDELSAHRREFAPYVFADFGDPFASRPQTCEWRAGGKTKKTDLSWARIDYKTMEKKLYDAAFGAKPGFLFQEWRPGAFWISTPDFQYTNDAGGLGTISSMQSILDEIRDHAAALKDAKVIVFDVRGNDGGSSTWGDQILNAIWGDDFTKNMVNTRAERIDWRISQANIDANKRYRESMARSGNKNGVAYYDFLIDGMVKAQQNGEDFFKIPSGNDKDTVYVSPAVKPRVILLSNGTCVSACLDFADEVLSIKGAELWGWDTSADSVYIDNRGDTLPSGLMRVSLPMKVWRGRARGNNQPYRATRKYGGVFQSTEEAQEWVERELKKQAGR